MVKVFLVCVCVFGVCVFGWGQGVKETKRGEGNGNCNVL